MKRILFTMLLAASLSAEAQTQTYETEFGRKNSLRKKKQNKQLLNTENKNESSFPYISRLQ